MPHYYASIPALDHKVFKYCGYVHPLNEDHHRRTFEDYGATGQPAAVSDGPSDLYKVLSFDEYKGDQITKDGEHYGEQDYTSKQIVLTRREDDDTVFRMLWTGQSSPKDEQACREYATKDGWIMHCLPVGAKSVWDTCIARHIEIEVARLVQDCQSFPPVCRADPDRRCQRGGGMRLENWHVVASNDPDASPECQARKLTGEVFGHPRFEDGTQISTSRIEKIDGNRVTTKSGSVYTLGAPAGDSNTAVNQEDY